MTLRPSRKFILPLLQVCASLATVTSGQAITGQPGGPLTCDQIRTQIKQGFLQTYEKTLPVNLIQELLPLWIQLGLPNNCQENSKSVFQSFNPSSVQDAGGPLSMLGSTGAIYTTSSKSRSKREAGLSDVTDRDSSAALVRNKRFIGGLGLAGLGLGGAGGRPAAKKEVSESAKMMNMLMMLSRLQKSRFTSDIVNANKRGNSFYGDRVSFGGGLYGDQYYGKRKKRAAEGETAADKNLDSSSSIVAKEISAGSATEKKSRVKRFFLSEPSDAPMGFGMRMGMGNPMASMMSVLMGAPDPASGRPMKFGGDAMKDMMRNRFINTLPLHARPPPGKEPGDFIKDMAPLWYFSRSRSGLGAGPSYDYRNDYVPPRTSGFVQRRNRDGTFGDKFPRFGKRKKRSSDDNNDSGPNTEVVTFGDVTVPLEFFQPPERDAPSVPPPVITPRPVFIPVYRPFIPRPMPAAMARRPLPATVARRPFIPPAAIPRRPFVPPAAIPRRPFVPPAAIPRRPFVPPAAIPRRPFVPPPPATPMRLPPPANRYAFSRAAPIPRYFPTRPAAAPVPPSPFARRSAFAPPPPAAAMPPPTHPFHGRKKRASEGNSDNGNNNDVIQVGDVSIPLDFFKPSDDAIKYSTPTPQVTPRYYPVYYPVYHRTPAPTTYRPHNPYLYRQHSARKPFMTPYQQQWAQMMARRNLLAQQQQGTNHIYPQPNLWAPMTQPARPPMTASQPPPPPVYTPPQPMPQAQPHIPPHSTYAVPSPAPQAQPPPPQPVPQGPPPAPASQPTPSPIDPFIPNHPSAPQPMLASRAAQSPYYHHYQPQQPLHHQHHYHHRRYKRSDNNDKTDSNGNNGSPILMPFLFPSPTPPLWSPIVHSPLLRPSRLPGKMRVGYTPVGGAIYGDRIPWRAPIRRPLVASRAAPAPPPPAPLPLTRIAPPPPARVAPPPPARVAPPPPARVPPPPPARVPPPPPAPSPLVPAAAPAAVPPPPAPMRFPVAPPLRTMPIMAPRVAPPMAPGPNPYSVLAPPAPAVPIRSPAPAVPPPAPARLPPRPAPAALPPPLPRAPLPLVPAAQPPAAPAPVPPAARPLVPVPPATRPLVPVPAAARPPPPVPGVAVRPPPPPARLLYPNGLFYNPNNMIIPPPKAALPPRTPPAAFRPPPPAPARPLPAGALPAAVPESAYAPIPVYQPQPPAPAAAAPPPSGAVPAGPMFPPLATPPPFPFVG